ncbi:MAG: DUF4412 domain-containing protein [Firmicutes bacterium]|nr:DUF4412 domain-containing protein [Bacillota bacterium]
MQRQKLTLACWLTLICCASVWAELPAQGPQLRGVWSPKVGGGAVYEIHHPQHGKTQFEFAVVGEEKVVGKTAYWVEMRMTQSEEGRLVIKSLVVFEAQKPDVLRMIMQSGDEPPMEIPVLMQRNTSQPGGPVPQDIRAVAEHLGTETVTTPAGSFTCDHFRMKDGTADVWISQQVAPYGIVKMTGRDGSMTLLKLLEGERSQIRSEPQKMPLMPGLPPP